MSEFRKVTIGKALCDVLNEVLGIDSRWIFAIEGDAHQVTVWRGVEDSLGRPALAYREDGEIEPAMVSTTYDVHAYLPDEEDA